MPGIRARLAVVALIVTLTGCAWIERSSVTSSPPAAVQGNLASSAPSLSQTGRFVAFTSDATNLVSGDTNGVSDVFVRDHTAHTTERVSIAGASTQADGASRNASISDDGRFVAFETDASNLFTGDADGKTDIVVRDRQLGTTSVVSVAPNGSPVLDEAIDPAISGNGGFVAFFERIPFQQFCCVKVGPFVRDLGAQSTTAMPSISGGIAQGRATLSDDGARIVYGAIGQPNQIGDAPFAVGVADTASASVIAVIVGGTLSHQFQSSFEATLSGDGATAGLILATQGTGTIYTSAVAAPALVPVLGGLFSVGQLALSDDAAVIAFRYAPGGLSRYAVTDPMGSAPVAVSANAIWQPASSVDGTDLSGDGRWVSFAAFDSTLVGGDTNGVTDVFVRSVKPSMTGP